MHILAGKYKNKRLQSSLSPKVKPTVRRLRETLFNYLGERVVDARFLDLCAGSGAVGIEALSRGAAHATFVDRSVKFCHFIMTNLDTCEIPEDEADVVADDAVLFLQRAQESSTPPWDVVFYDPPYEIDYGPVLAQIGQGGILIPDSGFLIAEHLSELEMPLKINQLSAIEVFAQGDSCLTVFVCE
jgi:16S rRNA (guanine(966)-N(2))-methyltransferase RsmD